MTRREPGRLRLLREAQLRGGVDARHEQRAETGYQKLEGAALHSARSIARGCTNPSRK